jgi:hypothetical protein
MGCGCKGGKKQVINNVDNINVITYAKEIYDRVILPNTTGEYSDVDKIEIMGAYASIYPASSQTPTIEEAINQIKIGIELYGIRKRR